MAQNQTTTRRAFVSSLAAVPAAAAAPTLASGEDPVFTATEPHSRAGPAPAPVDRTSFQRIIGPVLPAATIKTLGPIAQKYLADFISWEAKHWRATGAAWEQGNYYDRAKIDYAMWSITGNDVYRDHANGIALSYRGYLESGSYLVQPHWAMMKGLALHSISTGDEASRKAVGQVADLYAGWGYFNKLSTSEIDGRIKARTLEAILLAKEINAPSIGTAGGFAGGNDWTARAREALNKILAGQRADGTYGSTWSEDLALDGSGYVIRPFMEGLINDTLIDYYLCFEKDARILGAVKRNIDALWQFWDATKQGFLYNSKETAMERRSAVPAPDANNLIVEGFGFVYAMTGDGLYKQRGDAVFAGGVKKAYLNGQKQFNQQYTASYNYLALTNPDLATVTGDSARAWL
jgi:hypothetical protein